MCQDGVCRAATCPRQPQHSLPWAPERAAYLGHKSREKRAPDADRLSSTVLTLLTGSGQCSTIFETKTVLQEMPKAMDSQAAGDAAVPGLKMARRPMHTRSCDRPEVPSGIRPWWQPRLRPPFCSNVPSFSTSAQMSLLSGTRISLPFWDLWIAPATGFRVEPRK